MFWNDMSKTPASKEKVIAQVWWNFIVHPDINLIQNVLSFKKYLIESKKNCHEL